MAHELITVNPVTRPKHKAKQPASATTLVSETKGLVLAVVTVERLPSLGYTWI